MTVRLFIRRLLLCFLAALVLPAFGEDRAALVIGNSAYGFGALKNPVNDAHDMSVRLKLLGFDVVERTNLATRDIGSTLREFRSRLKPGGTALVFYAGHGLQVRNENYFPMVDADLSSEEDVPTQSLAMRQIMDLLESARTRLNLIFLDACRNNPFSSSMRSVAKGLARVEAPSGTLVSYATRPGSVASDGSGKNGLYTEHLLRQMDKAGQPIEIALKNVLTGVKRDSRGAQEPWLEGGIEGDFYFNPAMSPAAASAAAHSAPPPAAVTVAADSSDNSDEAMWQAVRHLNSSEDFTAYLNAYPNGRHAGEARAKLGKTDFMRSDDSAFWKALGTKK